MMKSPSSYSSSSSSDCIYGLIIESAMHFGQMEYGEAVWSRVLEDSGCPEQVFITHRQYDISILPGVANSCAKIIGGDKEEYFIFFGRCFVRYCTHYGYDKMLKLAGRNFCHFLQEIDNIHAQMRFSFRKMKSPSMVVTQFDEDGAVLQYRSERIGFTFYVIVCTEGQLLQVASDIFHLDLEVSVIKEETGGAGHYCASLRLNFDNSDFLNELKSCQVRFNRPLLPDTTIGKLKDMTVKFTGARLRQLLGDDIIGSHFSDHFNVVRPQQLRMSWEEIVMHDQVAWELNIRILRRSSSSSLSSRDVVSLKENGQLVNSSIERTDSNDALTNLREELSQNGSALESTKNLLLLKGQLNILKDKDMAILLCKPLLNDMDEMQSLGLYLDDLTIHDLSRDLFLAGHQHFSRFEQIYGKAEEYSTRLKESLQFISKWKTRGDELLYSMLPRQVAEVLRHGDDAITTCQSFKEVSVLFAEAILIQDTEQIEPLELVKAVNEMYSLLDNITDQYAVFKVETVGGVYMVVGGAPDYRPDHAEQLALMALHMTDAVSNRVPRTHEIRIGMHIGQVVAGVVGNKLPRYCIFGDTVNTAARMQTNSKGKGEMNTYWLDGKKKAFRFPFLSRYRF